MKKNKVILFIVFILIIFLVVLSILKFFFNYGGVLKHSNVSIDASVNKIYNKMIDYLNREDYITINETRASSDNSIEYYGLSLDLTNNRSYSYISSNSDYSNSEDSYTVVENGIEYRYNKNTDGSWYCMYFSKKDYFIKSVLEYITVSWSESLHDKSLWNRIDDDMVNNIDCYVITTTFGDETLYQTVKLYISKNNYSLVSINLKDKREEENSIIIYAKDTFKLPNTVTSTKCSELPGWDS